MPRQSVKDALQRLLNAVGRYEALDGPWHCDYGGGRDAGKPCPGDPPYADGPCHWCQLMEAAEAARRVLGKACQA
jgi:hypothetical protein